MAELKYLKKYSAETDICTLCGTCRTVCPVFLEEGIESSSTRGRISLINGLLTKDLTFTKNLSGKMYSCLNCRKCIEVCPANVNFTDLIIAAKADINLNNKKYFQVVFLKYLFNSNPAVSNFSHKFLRSIRNFIYKKKTFTLNILGKLIFKLLSLPRTFIMPVLPEKFFFAMKSRHELIGEQKKRVALFLGCGGKYNYPHSSDHLINLLRNNGIEVLIPENQVCCGSPLLDNGNVKLAKMNALKNLKVFNNIQDISAILVQCSSCSFILKHQYKNFLSVGKFKTPVIDIMEFIKNEDIDLTPRYSSKVSCHIMQRNHNDINKDNFIDDTVNSVYSENHIGDISDDKCCGASELYKTRNYDTRKILTHNFLEKYIKKNIGYIACNSFACIHTINEEASQQNKDIKAVSITDIFEV
ncbi:MAG: (Fe-S)-binding protein [Candidatus Delongbacteria bacterium]|jgi:glycolate oxidase iron-sulfur subunit|nr:(Fe-S)-binding protein [Candidatus Delongbacteria bacterium]